MPNACNQVLKSDTRRVGRFSDVVRGVRSVRNFVKFPAYPIRVDKAIARAMLTTKISDGERGYSLIKFSLPNQTYCRYNSEKLIVVVTEE